MEHTYYLAVDIGASSGRHILGHVESGKLFLEEIYRFENELVKKNGHLCWDVEKLFSHVLQGMKACKAAGKVPVSMGVDTWGVDFVLLDPSGAVLGDTVAYRDGRTAGMDAWVEERIPFSEHYERTGTQKQSFNTVYQLAALQKECPGLLEKAERLLFIPDYFHYRLTGKQENEYTEATTSGLIHAAEKSWDEEILERLGFPKKIFGKPGTALRMPGTVLGGLLPEIQRQVEFNCQVVLPATHDTGSAFLAVPAKGEQSVYLSSGTWSLLGMENERPITTKESREANFTNEGGYRYRFRYLKNIMGLWMIQSVRRELGKSLSFSQLAELAQQEKAFTGVVNVNESCFMAPESMRETIKAQCEKSGVEVPKTLGQVMQCIYRSLALEYARAIKDLEKLTGKRFTAVNIVGGGSQDGYLNQLTASAAGIPVFAGPTEGTALGNLMVQMIEGKEFSSLEEARKAERNSFEIKKFEP